MMNSKDYVFQINWEDRLKNSYVIGILAQIEKEFYLVFKDKKDIETAYKQGYIGIPGFNVEEVYKSQELFDFFKNRILQTAQANPCEELAKTRGVSMVDSFFVDPVPERIVPKYRQIILDAYEIQKRKIQIKDEKQLEETNVSTKKEGLGEFSGIE